MSPSNCCAALLFCSQLLAVLVTLGRVFTFILINCQLLPMPTSFATLLRFRVEALMEMFVINTMEYVSSVCMCL